MLTTKNVKDDREISNEARLAAGADLFLSHKKVLDPRMAGLDYSTLQNLSGECY